MCIMGAILGDIAGSEWEFDRCQNPRECELFSMESEYTDDTVMLLAVKWAIDNGVAYDVAMRKWGRKYPDLSYGGNFVQWLETEGGPYNSYGNGSAMRVAYIADKFDDLETVQSEAKKSAEVTHNHPEGIKGAVVTATCMWMAKHGKSKDEILAYMLENYPDKPLESYSWNETCQGSVPVAVKCFYESENYEDFIRRVLSLDCDTDTICAIGGGIAEAYYGGTGLDNDEILNCYLDRKLLELLNH